MEISNKEQILRHVKENDVKFIRLWFTDILGFLKSFAITDTQLESAFDEGMGFDGSSIQGYARIDESDMIAKPDPSTFTILPWRPNDGARVAKMFCDIMKPGGGHYEGDPRWILKRNLQKAKEMGYEMFVGPELEYFYFEDSKKPVKTLDYGGYKPLRSRKPHKSC